MGNNGPKKSDIEKIKKRKECEDMESDLSCNNDPWAVGKVVKWAQFDQYGKWRSKEVEKMLK